MQNEVVLAEKNKELNVASKIQVSMLPTNFNDYEKYGVDIFAYMDPAKEVGGDFYDFFMTYTNAGQCLPLVRKNSAEFKYLEDIHGTFIGCKLFKEINYGESVIDFKNGDTLCLYTDGVSEAQNSKEELFGTERLLKCVNNIDVNANSKEVVGHIINDVKTFEEELQQADDITILCIKCIK